MTARDRIHPRAPRRSVAAALLQLIYLASCGLAGCGTVKITLLADAATNQGRPLQVVVRSVDEQAYRSDSYAAAARLVTAPSSVVLRRLVLDPRPELRRSFRIKPPPGHPVALYLLYTAPTGNWKMLLMPPLPFSVTVPLGKSGIAVEQVSEPPLPLTRFGTTGSRTGRRQRPKHSRGSAHPRHPRHSSHPKHSNYSERPECSGHPKCPEYSAPAHPNQLSLSAHHRAAELGSFHGS